MISSINCMKPTLLQMIGEHGFQNWCVCVLDFQVSPQNGFPPSGAAERLRFYASRRREKLAWKLRVFEGVAFWNGGKISFQEESVWCLKKIMAICPPKSSEKFCRISGLIGPDLGNMTETPRKYCSWKLRFWGPLKGSTWLASFCKIWTWVQV